MDKQERSPLGRFVMRANEYLVAVRARESALALTTMLFADEVRPTKGIAARAKRPPAKQLQNAVAIIEELSTEWDPESYEDCYRRRLKRVIDAKRKRRTIEAPRPEKEPDPVTDLMAALDGTLERLHKGEDPRAEDGAPTDGERAGKRRKRATASR